MEKLNVLPGLLMKTTRLFCTEDCSIPFISQSQSHDEQDCSDRLSSIQNIQKNKICKNTQRYAKSIDAKKPN